MHLHYKQLNGMHRCTPSFLMILDSIIIVSNMILYIYFELMGSLKFGHLCLLSTSSSLAAGEQVQASCILSRLFFTLHSAIAVDISMD